MCLGGRGRRGGHEAAVPRFRMVYVSPVHVRERSGELAQSAFSADRRRRGGGAAGTVVTDVAVQIVGMLWFVAAFPNSI